MQSTFFQQPERNPPENVRICLYQVLQEEISDFQIALIYVLPLCQCKSNYFLTLEGLQCAYSEMPSFWFFPRKAL